MGVRRYDTVELLQADINRFFRLYKREDLPMHLVGYITDNYIPKVPVKKGDAIVVDKEVIIGLVCGYFKVSLLDMRRHSREEEVRYPRQVLQYLLFTRTMMSATGVGAFFKMHHTSILSSRNRIRELMEKRLSVRIDLEYLINQLPKEEVQIEPE